MKIYVITKGSYSDYRICAVSTDKEKAEKLARLYTDRYDEAEVEEYDTDADVDLFEGRIPYEVRFTSTGEVSEVTKVAEYRTDFKPCIVETFRRGQGSHPFIYVRLFASSDEEAVKIAAEKRAEHLGRKEGPA